MNIAVCDDELNIVNTIEDSIKKMPIEGLSCDVFLDGKELIEHIKKGNISYNIYLLDIEMPKKNGIATATAIRENDKDALIVFITDHKEYVYEIFEVLPFRFLRKPVSFDNLSCVLLDAVEHIRMAGQIFFFQIGHDKYQLHYHEIIYFEGAGRKVVIHTATNTYEIYEKTIDILSRLDKNLFCQAHASYIVNMDYIRSIQKVDIILQNGTLLPISKKYRNEVKQAHLSFIGRRCGS